MPYVSLGWVIAAAALAAVTATVLTWLLMRRGG